MSLFKKLFGDPNARVIAKLQPIVEKINALESSFAALTPEALAQKTHELKDRLARGADIDDLLPEAFAAVREAAKRTLGQRHFDVQLVGGMVLHRGEIAEMRTGEGKTLTATLPVYLNALSDKGVHVVTVNDYLAKRDAVWMGQIYHALGMSVGCIQHESAFIYDSHYTHAPGSETEAAHDEQRDTTGAFRVHADYLRPVSRQEAYLADITYGTNNEYGFDYLRDNMVRYTNQMVQRPLHYAIVDEVDSILIDEARTPLIISAPAEESTERYYQFADLVRRLNAVEDYNVDEKMRAANFTESGQDKITAWLGADPWKQLDGQVIYHLEAALKAHALYQAEREYVVKDGEVIIVDEFTGRLMFGRRYSEGLHQAIEAKEGVTIQRESKTLATVTFQNYFRLYKKLAGMTGTAVTEAEEFSKIYGLEVTVIPTNQPMIRQDLSDRVYATEQGKLKAVAREIRERFEKGQPVLVGTISIEKNEQLSTLLARQGIPHELLNAKNHEREAEIIAQAGRPGAVTVATNMAGRGVDIILGGNPPDAEAAAAVRAAGGLLVLGTERHESRRIDNQLRGRSGRQGDPGGTQFYVSMEDDLMRIFGPERMKNLMQKMGLPEDMPIENRMVSRAIEAAQRKVEGHNFDIRKHLLEYDDVLNKHREVFYRKRAEVLAAAEQTAVFSPSLGTGETEGMEKPRDLKDFVFELVESEIEQVVLFHTAAEREEQWNLDEVIEVMRTMLPLNEAVVEQVKSLRREAGGKLADAEARTSIIETLVGFCRQTFEKQEKEINDPVLIREIIKSLMLDAMDNLWIEHLDAMHYLRTGIGLRGYGQRDPLVEYKREAYLLFNELLGGIQKRVAYTLFRAGPAVRLADSSGLLNRSGLRLFAPAKTSGASNAPPSPAFPLTGEVGGGGPGQATKKVGRNEPCHCGSGKKYKKCHGA
ncbi:preprotein translocase subunit SecA [Candidatus Uhrbacteria bacterium]|nr:preprotein translocase subunit SecA [Candidatus Uhrbacteria bacterium]